MTDLREIQPSTLLRLEQGVARKRQALAGRELATDGALAALFIGGAAALAVLGDPTRELDPLLAAAFVAAYALVAGAEFTTGAGYMSPTLVVLVPMLLLLPTPVVPLLTALALVLKGAVQAIRGSVAPPRVLVAVADGWVTLPLAVVLVAADAQLPDWGHWPAYLAALAVLAATDAIVTVVRFRAAVGVSTREALQEVVAIYRIDALLFPTSLLAAMGAAQEPWTALLVLPLVGLFVLLSREREGRIAHAVELSQAYRGTALLLRDVIEQDDEYTGRHTQGVVELSVEVADALGVDAETRRATELGALLHDIGKIAVPNEIINKPGPLDPSEWRVIRTHTVAGQQMLERVGGVLGRVGAVVRASHERWDGAGYPDGLAGERIPLAARIVAACDAYNAMVTDRPYRHALPARVAVQELERHAGTQFDPWVVRVLLQILRPGRFARGDAQRSPSLRA